jgi:hypothetical protein
MFKKFNNLTLIIVLAALVGVYFIVQYTGGKKKSKSLRTELVQIDTAKVSKVTVEANGELVDIYQEAGVWKLKLSDGKIVGASDANIKSALGALLTVKPSRMASRKESKWTEYQVDDSTGTRVQVYEGSDKTLDIMLGRFGVQGQKSYHTFVRLFEDKEVYVANNFMNFSVPSDAASYRNQQLMRTDQDTLIAVTLNYPADSSVQLSNNGGLWFANGQLADSTAIIDYFSELDFVNSKAFEDDKENIAIPVLTARYSFSNREDITIDAYQKNNEWVINSSENKESYFKDTEIMKSLFVGLSYFVK